MIMEEKTIYIRYDLIEKNRYVRTLTYKEDGVLYVIDSILNFFILNNLKDPARDFNKCVLMLKNKPLKMFKSQ